MKIKKKKKFKTKNWKTKNQKPKNCKTKNRRARPSHFAISGTSHIIVRCIIVGRVVVKEWVTLCWFLLIIYGENGKFSKFTLVLWTNFKCYAVSNSAIHKYFAESSLHLFAGAIDHKGLLRGRYTLYPCVAYKQAKISNKYAECCCPSSVHVNKGTLFTIFLLAAMTISI